MNAIRYTHVIAVAMVLTMSELVIAAPAVPQEVVVTQSSGETIRIIQQGDEWQNWVEDSAGYTVSRSSGDGDWYYVAGFSASRVPVLAGTLADALPPRGLRRGVKPRALTPYSTSGFTAPTTANSSAPSGPYSGPVLFILTEFDDQAGTTTASSWGTFVTNNIVDYFDKASHGKVTLTPATESSGTANDGVIGWVNVGYDHPDTAGNTGTDNRLLARDAILAADAYIDYSSYDTNNDGQITSDELSIVTVIAGNEEATGPQSGPSVWGHAWCIANADGPAIVDGVQIGGPCGSIQDLIYGQFGEFHYDGVGGLHQATMGIMVHELGHLTFAYPDLYDIDGSSAGIAGYGVMGAGTWGFQSSEKQGATPTMPSAWARGIMQWADTPEGTGTESLVATGSSSATSSNTVVRRSTPIPTEYFLFENRQLEGYDAGLWGLGGASTCGLAIWHIDDTQGSNANDNDRWVDLEDADNTPAWPMSGDLYGPSFDIFGAGTSPSSDLKNGSPSGITVTQISSCATTMTADFDGVIPPLTCMGLPLDVDLNLGQTPSPGNVSQVIGGTPGNDFIEAYGGNDIICGYNGYDELYGGGGSDYIFGGDSNGNDNTFNDLYGGTGKDNLYGGSVTADNWLYGQGGADYMYDGSILDGGSGSDTLDNTSFQNPTVMQGGGNNDVMDGSDYVDEMYGGPGLDTMYGFLGADIMNGDKARDTMYGGAGNDVMSGGAANDFLYGEAGDDSVEGNSGNDTLDGGPHTTGDACDGGSYTTQDTLLNCETAASSPGLVMTLSRAPLAPSSQRGSQVPLTAQEVQVIDRCNLTVEECLSANTQARRR